MIVDTIRFLKDNGKSSFYDAEHSFDGYQGRTGVRARHLAGRRTRGRRHRRALRHQRRVCLSEVASHHRRPQEPALPARHPHPRRHRASASPTPLAAIDVGATQVQGTINGYGERTGNCNLTSIIPTVHFKIGLRCVPAKSMPKLKRTLPVRRRDRQHPPRPAPTLGRRRPRSPTRAACTSTPSTASPAAYEHIDPHRRQLPPGAGQRHVRPQQHPA
jgi:2-isopropylmalate synthase